jgi:hypothetical protein
MNDDLWFLFIRLFRCVNDCSDILFMVRHSTPLRVKMKRFSGKRDLSRFFHRDGNAHIIL